MTQGSKPTDGGNLLFDEEDATAFIKSHPELASYMKTYLGSREFLHNKKRYVLWLDGVSPALFAHNRDVLARLEKVKATRAKSPTRSVREKAQTPYLFTEIRQPNTNYMIIPRVSSSRREYMPVGYESPSIIASDAVWVAPNANIISFGIISSSVHNFWLKVTAGRMKSDYRYSSAVWNNFPWPNLDDKSRKQISKTAQGILDARKLYPDSSLADLYDPLTMPVEFRKAHEANDKAVLKAYGLKPSATEQEIVQHLFEMYEKLTSKEK